MGAKGGSLGASGLSLRVSSASKAAAASMPKPVEVAFSIARRLKRCGTGGGACLGDLADIQELLEVEERVRQPAPYLGFPQHRVLVGPLLFS